MEKRGEAAFFGYFAILFLLVINGLISNIDIVNMVYLVVVLCCILKFVLIVNKDRK